MARKKTEEQNVFVPDIPAQMEEESVELTVENKEEPQEEVVVVEEKIEEVVEGKESEEVLFLKEILRKQHDGGFGKHLDYMINERIKFLKSK